MFKVFQCRRSFLALVAMCMLFVLGWMHGEVVAPHIVTIVLGIAGANAAQGVLASKPTGGPNANPTKQA